MTCVKCFALCLVAVLGAEAWAQGQSVAEPSLAETRAREALAANPTLPSAYQSLGQALYDQKKYTEAIEAYRKGKAMGATFPWAITYDIACCYALNGDKESALKALMLSLDEGWRDMAHLRTDTDLNSLHADSRWEAIAFVKDTSKMSREEGWRYDLKFYSRELKRLRFNVFNEISERDFDAFVHKLDRDIPKLTNNQIAARFMLLAGTVNDGHTSLNPTTSAILDVNSVPLSVSSFPEGYFVVATDRANEGLLGGELVSIEGKPIEEVVKLVDPYVGNENSQWLRVRAPRLLVRPGFLNGIGVAKKPDELTLGLKMSTGQRTVLLKATALGPGSDWITLRSKIEAPAPLTWKSREKRYWFEQIPGTKVVFAQYNSVQNDQAEPLGVFWGRMFKFIEDNQIEKLILDMRWNGGGNNFLNAPLLNGLIRSRINVRGSLFVITGPNTFSAAICGLTQIERYTNAIICGEPGGSPPNFIGETIQVALPYSKITGSISDLYWQNSHAMDHRIWIPTTIYVPYTFADYSANKDSVIDAILNYKP